MFKEFVHQPYQPEETIAAVATPPGDGGVAIIRLSGKNALEVASKIYSGPIKEYKSHTVHYGQILDQNRKNVDDVLIIPMHKPRSYTGEDTVEICCHGGALITRRVLDIVLSAGARAANPGEFTFRAFINGKIDLAQAEAIQELISAKNERAVDAAEEQLKGSFSKIINSFQKGLTEIAAILEAWVDFPEEGLEFATLDEICDSIQEILKRMQELVLTFHDGKIVSQGIALCLAGSPNVGKSSLMNALLDRDRAIVSHIAGTTRDILEDHLLLNGLNFKLIDTAGIRETEEVIEKEGIRRSQLAMNESDLILLVLDASKALSYEDNELLSKVPKEKTLIVWNKIDLKGTIAHLDFPHIVEVSALQKLGLKALKNEIDKVIWKKGPPSKEEVLVTNVRHKEALLKSMAFLEKVIEGLKNETSAEFVSFEMRSALMALGEIIGTNISEDILSAIFSKFCIGK